MEENVLIDTINDDFYEIVGWHWCSTQTDTIISRVIVHQNFIFLSMGYYIYLKTPDLSKNKAGKFVFY